MLCPEAVLPACAPAVPSLPIPLDLPGGCQSSCPRTAERSYDDEAIGGAVGPGFGIGLGIITVSQASTAGLISGVTLGILIATPFILFATVISTYTATAYHTCLYLWARDVERARLQGQTGSVIAPGPLASALQ